MEWENLKEGETYFYLADSPGKKNSFLTTAGNEGIEGDFLPGPYFFLSPNQTTGKVVK